MTIDTTSLTEGVHACTISIHSNAGTGQFTVRVNVTKEKIPPVVELLKPRKHRVYIRNKEKMWFFKTIIIGPITVKVNATDMDGYIEKVEFYVDGKLKHATATRPYYWVWQEFVIGKHTLKVIAYDNDGLASEDIMNVTIVCFNLTKVKDYGIVWGKVTEAGRLLHVGIPNVKVIASDGTNTTTKRLPLINRGEYRMKLPPGVYTITFRAEGYKEHREYIEVTPGDEIKLDVRLEKGS